MVLLLGASGYIGTAFSEELNRRSIPFYVLHRADLDYTKFADLWAHLNAVKPSFVINAAGFTGRPNVDACESARAEALLGNSLFPQALAQACLAANIPFGHVSSGCIYSGAKVVENGQVRIEPDLALPRLRDLIDRELQASQTLRSSPEVSPLQPSAHAPKASPSGARLLGFTEQDAPNFSFRAPPCSFYSGTKALAEEVLAPLGNGFLWRLRIPFDHLDNPRNYLTKLQTYAKVYDNVNSISHRGDFVRACLDLWEMRAPFGLYNITNPGWVTTRYVVERIIKLLKPDKTFEFWQNDSEFYKFAKAPRSNCIMDVSKLLAAGVNIRPIHEALDRTLRHWQPSSPGLPARNFR